MVESVEVSNFTKRFLVDAPGMLNDILSISSLFKLAIAPFPPCNDFQIYLRYTLVWNSHFTKGSLDRYIPQNAPTVMGNKQPPS